MRTEITRREYEREGRRYASDATEAKWAQIEGSLPPTKPGGRPANWPPFRPDPPGLNQEAYEQASAVALQRLPPSITISKLLGSLPWVKTPSSNFGRPQRGSGLVLIP